MEETQETTGFNHSLFPQRSYLITGLQRRKEEILKMHGQCELYADDKMTGYGLNTGYSDKEKKEYYLRCIRDIP